MAFASFEPDEDAPLTEINMIPLIDVMLVLLIIFLVTAPLLTHAVKVDLPKAQSEVNQTPPEHVQIAIDAAEQYYWAGEPVSLDELRARLRAVAAHDPRTEPQLRADEAVAYRAVARAMSEAARHGLTRIGFVTDPGLAQGAPHNTTQPAARLAAHRKPTRLATHGEPRCKSHDRQPLAFANHSS